MTKGQLKSSHAKRWTLDQLAAANEAALAAHYAKKSAYHAANAHMLSSSSKHVCPPGRHAVHKVRDGQTHIVCQRKLKRSYGKRY